MDDVAHQDASAQRDDPVPVEPEAVPPHFRTREEKRAAIKEFWRDSPPLKSSPESLLNAYWEEREALRHMYPNSLVDLGRQGVIKVRVFRGDGSSYMLPEGEEVES